MLLQMIVIHYDEDDSYIKTLLDMLKMQQLIDFSELGVLIENDGDKAVIKDETLQGYPFEIQYHVNPGTGRSGVRQFGLDRAAAEYVMFCDCDDTLLRFTSLYDIFQKLITEKPDVLATKFIADHGDNGNMFAFSEYFDENVWIHGKCGRTQFLRDNNIRGNIKLNNFEDSFFVRLTDAHNPKKSTIAQPTYLWKYRESSCTRNDGSKEMLDYKNKSFSEMELIKALVEHNLSERASNFMYALELECYYTMMSTYNGEDLQKDYTNDIELVESRFIKFYQEYNYLLQYLTPEIKSILYNAMHERFFKNYNRSADLKYTFEQWIALLEERYSEEEIV